MKPPSLRGVLLTAIGIAVGFSLGGLIWVSMGGQKSTAMQQRIQQAATGVVERLKPAEAACPAEVTGLSLPVGMAADDPRLQGANLIVVRKSVRRIQRFTGGRALLLEGGKPACWGMGLGPAPQGHKYRQGDGRTPEGWYRTSDKPWSQWYGAIAIHYPNAHDAEAGRVQGRINKADERRIKSALSKDKKPLQNTQLGGEILIHGQGGFTDWTLGCVAMNNDELDVLRATLPEGMRTDVLVLP